MNFQKKGKENVTCSCCGYEATQVQCPARKVWEFHKDFVIVYHYGNHSCVAKTVDKSIRDDAAEFFRAKTGAKPSQYPYERLRKMLKEGNSVSDVYKSGCSMASLKDSAAQRHANIETPSERNVNSFNSRGEGVSFQARVSTNAFTGNGEHIR